MGDPIVSCKGTPSLPESEKLGEAEFKWGKKRGIGGRKKEVKFYESFTYDGVDYALYDCVYMYKKDAPAPYIGKLVKIWEMGNKAKRIKVHWFFRPSEISNHLRDVEVLENELFLASGNGTGLANVNTPEPIAGKCNVVCISTDSRNPQPSAKEIQMADYVFRCIFDVESLTLSDKMDDKVGDLEVKYVFNRREVQSVTVLGDDAAHLVNGAATPINAKSESELKDSVGCGKDVKLAGNLSSRDAELSKMKYSSSKETPRPGHSEDAVGLENESKLNKELNPSQGKLSKSNSFPSREILESAHEDSVRTEKDNKLGDLSAFSNMPSISNFAPCGETPGSSTPNVLHNGTPKLATDEDFEGSQQAAKLLQSSTSMKRSLKRSADLTTEKLNVEHAKSYEVKYKKRASNSCLKEGSLKKAKCDDAIKRTEDSKSSCPKEEGSIKKAKDNHAINQMEDGKDDIIKKLKEKKCVGETKISPKLATLYDNNPKSKLGEATLNNNEDDKLSSDNLLDPLISRSKGGEEVGVQVIEVTRRPIEKSKWIKLTWEEKMKTAHDEEKLVLLQNLDPEYSSEEVEDMMWHVFQEKCTAKMVPQTAISNPHSGQAFVVFGSRDAADRVLQRLDDGCLILPNERPLVGCLGVLPKLSGKQIPFVGHLSIDKARHQVQREKQEAVATSHYSQNNTIEYEMAMEWCLLQSRSDKWWEMLYQQQTKELAKLTNKLKTEVNTN